MNDWKEQADAPVKSQVEPSSLIADYCLALTYQRTEGENDHVVIAWLILCECTVREQAWGFWMFLADQQAGIPSGKLVTDQSDGAMDVGAGVIGGFGETGRNSLLLQETTEGEWLWLTMWLSGEEFGLLPDDEGLPLFLICSQVSPSALAKWSSTEPVMDTELVAVGSGSL